MPIPYHDAPRPADAMPHLALKRVPASGDLLLYVTCYELLQPDTHYMNGRTLPCVGEACPGCAAQRAKRYEAYISGVRGREKDHIILALTEGAARNIFDQVPNATQLRGHVIRLKRAGTRPNGTLKAIVEDNMCRIDRLPPAPELEKHLLKIWGIDQSHLAQDAPGYAAAVQKMYSRAPRADDA